MPTFEVRQALLSERRVFAKISAVPNRRGALVSVVFFAQ
jgi:hypothetical protein